MFAMHALKNAKNMLKWVKIIAENVQWPVGDVQKPVKKWQLPFRLISIFRFRDMLIIWLILQRCKQVFISPKTGKSYINPIPLLLLFK
jgi:hypothetical protein